MPAGSGNLRRDVLKVVTRAVPPPTNNFEASNLEQPAVFYEFRREN